MCGTRYSPAAELSAAGWGEVGCARASGAGKGGPSCSSAPAQGESWQGESVVVRLSMHGMQLRPAAKAAWPYRVTCSAHPQSTTHQSRWRSGGPCPGSAWACWAKHAALPPRAAQRRGCRQRLRSGRPLPPPAPLAASAPSGGTSAGEVVHCRARKMIRSEGTSNLAVSKWAFAVSSGRVGTPTAHPASHGSPAGGS